MSALWQLLTTTHTKTLSTLHFPVSSTTKDDKYEVNLISRFWEKEGRKEIILQGQIHFRFYPYKMVCIAWLRLVDIYLLFCCRSVKCNVLCSLNTNGVITGAIAVTWKRKHIYIYETLLFVWFMRAKKMDVSGFLIHCLTVKEGNDLLLHAITSYIRHIA